MKPVRILHVISSLSRGGATRALIANAKYFALAGYSALAHSALAGYSAPAYSAHAGAFQHRAVSLRPAAPVMVSHAHDAGIDVLDAPDSTTLHAALEASDIVLVHFWNTPELYEWLRADLPPLRFAFWFHVAGDQPPQIITRDLIEFSDCAVASSPHTLDSPRLKNLPPGLKSRLGIVPSGADWERLDGFEPKPHETFNVGYVGTVDFVKMHPHFVRMSALATIPHVQFIVCGSGGGFATLQRQAEAAGVAERFQFRGYLEDVRSVLQVLDVFGYPLCAENYSTAELALQEAMFAGIPPIVFPYGGAARLVKHNQTGLIVENETEYAHALEYLHSQPDERARLGRNARAHAQEFFGAAKSAEQWHLIFEKMLEQPKRMRRWNPAPAVQESGAELFIRSLGDSSPQFRASMTSGNEDERVANERLIAMSSPVLSGGDGGILSYRLHYPGDAYLRLWSGLVLQEQGHPALAAAEFVAAQRLGFQEPRVSAYLAKAMEK